jgi:hypothetical protein
LRNERKMGEKRREGPRHLSQKDTVALFIHLFDTGHATPNHHKEIIMTDFTVALDWWVERRRYQSGTVSETTYPGHSRLWAIDLDLLLLDTESS